MLRDCLAYGLSNWFSIADWGGCVQNQIIEDLLVVQHFFSFNDDLAKAVNYGDWEVTRSCLISNHNNINTITDCKRNVLGLWSWRSCSSAHWFKSLTCNHDWLGSNVGFLNHPFLGNKYLLDWDLSLKLLSVDDYTVRGKEDFVKVLKRLMSCNPRKQLSFRLSLPYHFSDCLNIWCLSNRWNWDEIDFTFACEVHQVVFVLIWEARDF